MLKAIIVDDENSGVESLQILLNKYCPTVDVLGVAYSADEAEAKIVELKPDLVFLDIDMPFANGFDLLNRFKDIQFEVIFTTAYDHYAVRAFKHSAIDYLLKPIDVDELRAAVIKCEKKKEDSKPAFLNMETVMAALNQARTVKKLSINTLEGIMFVDTDQIIRLSADSNYTNIFLKNGKKIFASKTLKEFEETLVPMHFFRVHNTHLINLAYVQIYTKGDGGYVTMIDNAVVEVSRSKKNELLSLLSLNKGN
jgi:two-component system LytT family response regulator